MWGEVYEPLVDDQWTHNPHFAKNSHERPVSIILEAKTYGFLTKKWSPPEIQECDLWQGNIPSMVRPPLYSIFCATDSSTFSLTMMSLTTSLNKACLLYTSRKKPGPLQSLHPHFRTPERGSRLHSRYRSRCSPLQAPKDVYKRQKVGWTGIVGSMTVPFGTVTALLDR